MNDLEIRFVKNKEELEQVNKIRNRIFVKEQNVSRDLEFDGLDSEAEHVIVFLGAKPIGCARIRTNKCAKLERIAILKEYRLKGFGKQLMKYLINYCKSKKYNEICLHSQTYISDFYKKCGFKTRGETFLEADIAHVEMYMNIRS
ncbi:MAG: GNAT family N-acetyltransferase [Thermoplasmatales archaeon]|nr:GNAT family N-acetyltransferase [Thermoplasmatales archaeon]